MAAAIDYSLPAPALVAALDAATNRVWRGWEPEGFPRASDEIRDKLFACQVAATNPDVFDTWPLFAAVCSAFNGRRANFEWLDDPAVEEAAWTCYALRQINPAGVFQRSVLIYLAACCEGDGLAYFPWTGGPGLAPSLPGVFEPDPELVAKLRSTWASGTLTTRGVEDTVDSTDHHSDPYLAQIAKILGIMRYIEELNNVSRKPTV